MTHRPSKLELANSMSDSHYNKFTRVAGKPTSLRLFSTAESKEKNPENSSSLKKNNLTSNYDD